MKPTLNFNLELKTGASPKGYDIAFASIDKEGKLGLLNTYVLKELGYSNSDIPKDLSLGFALLERPNQTTVVFIVTIDNDKASSDWVITEHLRLFLTSYAETLIDKSLWIPLLGTGTAGLDFVRSFEVIFKHISKGKFDRVTIALPNEIEPWESQLIHEIIQEFNNQYSGKPDWQDLVSRRKVFLAEYRAGSQDHSNRFIKEGLWFTQESQLRTAELE